MIGKTLGHYQITSQLGKGAMGEVFQAKDQKLVHNCVNKRYTVNFINLCPGGAAEGSRGQARGAQPPVRILHSNEPRQGRKCLLMEYVICRPSGALRSRHLTPGRASLARGYLLRLLRSRAFNGCNCPERSFALINAIKH